MKLNKNHIKYQIKNLLQNLNKKKYLNSLEFFKFFKFLKLFKII